MFNEPTLSGEFDVDASGVIALPLIGNIKAVGETPRQVEQVISTKLAAGYMRDPRVNVEVLKYRPFYIIGEVAKPGEYPYRNGMNLMSAVAVASGFTTTTMVFPGDIVRVPERIF